MDTDIHFTRILDHINAILTNTFSPSNPILCLTFSDFDALLNEILFFLTAQLVDKMPTFVKPLPKYPFCFPTFCCFHFLLALLFMYRLSAVSLFDVMKLKTNTEMPGSSARFYEEHLE